MAIMTCCSWRFIGEKYLNRGVPVKNIVLSASFAFLLGAALAAAADKPSPPADENARHGDSVSPVFSLELIPQLSLPVGRDTEVFTLGGGASLMARLPLPLHFLALEAGAGFEWAPIGVAQGKGIPNAALMLLWPWAGVGFDYDLFRNFTIGASVGGGYYFGSVNADLPNSSGHNPMFSAGAGVGYRLLPNLSVRVAALYRSFLGLYNDVAFSVGTSYHFLPRQETLLKLRPYTNLRLDKVELEPVFPVMYKYYDDHPVGKVTITNTGKIPLENVEVSLFVNQYMDNPKAGAVIPFVRGGDTLSVDLFALFNDRVMGISEATKVQANVSVSLSVAGENYGAEKIETLRIYDRNAMTWIDDRRVAAFIVAKDPAVMRFAKNVASATSDKISGIYDSALVRALAVHEALGLYGMVYQIDPSSPYSDETKKSGAVDYLQYPSQSLEFKAGDCDDLTILNASLLESLGVETAFITVPGHVYMAFALDMSAEEAIKRFSRAGKPHPPGRQGVAARGDHHDTGWLRKGLGDGRPGVARERRQGTSEALSDSRRVEALRAGGFRARHGAAHASRRRRGLERFQKGDGPLRGPRAVAPGSRVAGKNQDQERSKPRQLPGGVVCPLRQE